MPGLSQADAPLPTEPPGPLADSLKDLVLSPAGRASAPPIQLGFAVVPSSPLLPDAADFPSKIGGRPLWLNPRQVPKRADLCCATCGDPLVFLLQIYTPEEVPESAYHRVLYIFVCRSGKCHVPGANGWITGPVKALRQQLPRVNPCYPTPSAVPPTAPLLPLPHTPPCAVCGLSGDFKCAKGCRTFYCSKAHQVADWPAHKPACCPGGGASSPPPPTAWGFKEWELCSEEEVPPPRASSTSGIPDSANHKRVGNGGDKSEGSDKDDDEGERSDKDDDGGRRSDKDDDEGGYEKTRVGVDRTFLKFQKRVAWEPEQILRYYRVAPDPDSGSETETETDASASASARRDVSKAEPETDANALRGASEADSETDGRPLRDASEAPGPLYPRAPLTAPAPPPCPHCAQPRSLEAQVMPQLLAVLGLPTSPGADAMDWGSLFVWSCAQNCWVRGPGSGWEPEYAAGLAFSEEGMASWGPPQDQRPLT